MITNKTLEMHLADQREGIATTIEAVREQVLADAKELGGDAYLVASRTLMVCAALARGHK